MRGAEAFRNKRGVSDRLERERLLEQVRSIEDTLEAIDRELLVRGHE
jgi:hypothetical protein